MLRTGKDTFYCSLIATPSCASFIPRLANADDVDRPIYGLSAQNVCDDPRQDLNYHAETALSDIL